MLYLLPCPGEASLHAKPGGVCVSQRAQHKKGPLAACRPSSLIATVRPAAGGTRAASSGPAEPRRSRKSLVCVQAWFKLCPPAGAGVIVESEEIHRLAYNATFSHFDVRCPGGEGPVVWTEEYYEDLQNRVGAGWGAVPSRRPAPSCRL